MALPAPTTDSGPTATTVSIKDSRILSDVQSALPFQQALTLLNAEGVKVDLQTAVQKMHGEMTSFSFQTSRPDLALYATVLASGKTLIQLVTQDAHGNATVSDLESARTYKFNNEQAMISSGWATGTQSLNAVFSLRGQKPRTTESAPHLTPQSCTVPEDMYTDLYFAQNEAQNASDNQVAAAAAWVAADFSLMLCLGGPAPCAAAVSALALAGWNLNNASKAVTTANKKVQEQMRRINEWRRTNCS